MTEESVLCQKNIVTVLLNLDTVSQKSRHISKLWILVLVANKTSNLLQLMKKKYCVPLPYVSNK